MGKNPNVIFRELYVKAKRRHGLALNEDGSTQDPIAIMELEDHCFYTTYSKVVKCFILEGYSEQKANKHIMQWVDNDILTIRTKNGWRYVGFYEDL